MSRIIVSLCLLFLISCEQSSEKEAVDKQQVLSMTSTTAVDITTIENRPFQKQIIANGKVGAIKKSELRFKTSNRIDSIKVSNGQAVVKGQVLAVLDRALLANQLDRAKIDVEKSKRKLQEAKINFGIENPTAVIKPSLQKNLEIKSGFLEAQNALENVQLLYEQTVLKAPFSGLVANIETQEGNYITTGDIFCTIIAQQQLEVSFSVLENELPFIRKNQGLVIRPFVDVNKKYSGFISEINPLIDKNGLIKIKATINNPNRFLFDGMHVKVLINQAVRDVIVIPKEALVLRSNREVVFTLKNGVAKWNYVAIADENSNSYAIKEGLNLGDTIILSGNMNLSHDAKVTASLVINKE